MHRSPNRFARLLLLSLASMTLMGLNNLDDCGAGCGVQLPIDPCPVRMVTLSQVGARTDAVVDSRSGVPWFSVTTPQDLITEKGYLPGVGCLTFDAGLPVTLNGQPLQVTEDDSCGLCSRKYATPTDAGVPGSWTFSVSDSSSTWTVVSSDAMATPSYAWISPPDGRVRAGGTAVVEIRPSTSTFECPYSTPYPCDEEVVDLGPPTFDAGADAGLASADAGRSWVTSPASINGNTLTFTVPSLPPGPRLLSILDGEVRVRGSVDSCTGLKSCTVYLGPGTPTIPVTIIP